MKRQWLSNLADFLNDNNIIHIVTSPGSRNAPLLLHLANHKALKLYSHVDERSAGYIALGMAQYLQSTVALVCTSGSAILNYGPALAEAYYQHIPILVLSADRSPEWIDQSDGQSIRQNNVFHSYIRKSFILPVEINHPDDEWFIWRSLSEAIHYTKYPVSGPVHVNIPFREPLYEMEPYTGNKPKTVNVLSSLRTLDNNGWKELNLVFRQKKRIMIIAGLNYPDKLTAKLMCSLARVNNIIVLADINSNLYSESFIRASDDIITAISENGQEDYYPDVLITFGGTIISKILKNWIRKHPPYEHWHVNIAFEAPDTFQCLTKIIVSDINLFLKGLILRLQEVDSDFSKKWHDILEKINKRRNSYLEISQFSDFKACWTISKYLPNNSLLHLANSMPVRYAHFVDWPSKIKIFSNRGVNGIEGCISTAVGSAIHFKGFTTLITGDLAMLYDSNALWNTNFPCNLKIIVLNNGGGGIFRIIDGPDKYKTQRDFFETPHNYNMEYLSKMYNLSYIGTRNEKELSEALNMIYCDMDKPCILEIFTEQDINAEVYHNYFKYIINSC